jgi:hypothetical protein
LILITADSKVPIADGKEGAGAALAADAVQSHRTNIALRGAPKHANVGSTPPMHGAMHHVSDGTINQSISATQMRAAQAACQTLKRSRARRKRAAWAIRAAIVEPRMTGFIDVLSNCTNGCTNKIKLRFCDR